MPAIEYQVYDVDTEEKIGIITGAELRAAAGRLAASPVFNATLVAEFNAMKEGKGEPERIRSMIRR